MSGNSDITDVGNRVNFLLRIFDAQHVEDSSDASSQVRLLAGIFFADGIGKVVNA